MNRNPVIRAAASGAALLVLLAVGVPLLWLALRAGDADPEVVRSLLGRPRNLTLLGNTLALTATVVIGATLVGAPLAWLVVRTDLPLRRWVSVAAVLPLAVPGYVMAYALTAAGGPRGAAAGAVGLEIPRAGGLWGATLALVLYNFPYVFLITRAALNRLDPAPAEAARALGAGRWAVFRHGILPGLWPALLAAATLVALYTVGDFGVVSLMRFDTLSYALYANWSDLQYASWLALALILAAAPLLLIEVLASRRAPRARAGVGTARQPRRTPLHGWRWPLLGAVAALILLAVGLPLATTLWWLDIGLERFDAGDLLSAAGDSLWVALPAAAAAVVVAMPVAWAAHRSPGPMARAAERAVQLGYAIPPLALALAYVFFAIRFAPGLRDALHLLVAACVLHYLTLAMGPVRGTLHTATARHEEAARALGCTAVGALRRVTLPALRGGLAAGAVLVFLAVMKELPMTRLLSPLDFRTLAVGAWSFADEAMYADAAPYALCMLGIGTVAAAVTLRGEGHG